MAILIIGFDGYSDLWDDCINLFDKYWKNRNYDVYLANNTKKVNYEGIKVINCGEKAEWSKKVSIALSNIQEDYVCLLLEDFFIGDYVENKIIDNTLNFIKNEKIKYFKITDNNRFTPTKNPIYKNKKNLKVIYDDTDYGISLQPAIWEKKYLAELIGNENYNAWTFEINRLKEEKDGKKLILTGCIEDTRNILNIKHGVLQGKLLPSTIKYFKKNNYNIKSDREIMSFFNYRIYILKTYCRELLPNKFKKIIKIFLKKFGMEFVSDKYV